VSTKATAESVATKNADSQSHHSRRASCLRVGCACCARKACDPSRGEELGLLARRPSVDRMFLGRRPLHHQIKPLLQKKATQKWYRTIYFNDLTERPAWRSSGSLASELRVGATAAPPLQKKSASGRAGGALKKFRNELENMRSLRLGSGWLRRRWFWRGWLGWSGRSGLNRIGLIVEADDVLRDVDLRGSEENRSALRRGIQDEDVSVFAGIAVEHVHHLAADAVDNVGLSGVNVFLVFRIHALEALRKPLTLLPEAGFFFLAQLVLAGLKTLLQIIDLLVEIFDFVLPRCELRLQLRGRQLALRSGNDGLANADDADLACCGRTSRGRRLRPGGCGAQNARGGEGNGTSQHIS